jgi:SAM-dependent methyltransferase
MRIFRLRDYREYASHVLKMTKAFSHYETVENALVPRWRENFTVKGYSYPAGQVVDFAADFQYSVGGKVNWRERLACPITGLNNRMRATFHILEMEVAPYLDDAIYISEQVTLFYRFITSKFPNVTGSEYLGDKIRLGDTNERGIRNEDLTQLTFPDESFHYVLSLDCFEHFLDYQKAFKECYRVIKPGGKMLWSVPFDRCSERNIIRARIQIDGSIEHLLEPEYHGDPLSQDGCLCFTCFGWEMLEEVTNVGFSDAYAMLFWSAEFGYLGGEQILFLACK